ncbi:MAG: NHL repeat-containing protein, partial [Nitrospinae bacterium]|nr:NHL repeat-containing protein [Nitrospinota bacterium]
MNKPTPLSDPRGERTSPDALPGLVIERSIPLTGIPDPAPLSFHSLLMGDDGRFWISDEFNHRLLLFTPDGMCEKVIGGRGDGPGQFWYPAGMTWVTGAHGGELWVCDSWNHRVQRFDPTGGHLGMFGAIGTGEDQFDEPVALAPLPDGRVAILDRGNCRIRIVDREGTHRAVIGASGEWRPLREGVFEDQLADGIRGMLGAEPLTSYPMSFAVANATIMVADTNNHRLLLMDDVGKMLDVFPLGIGVWPMQVQPATGGGWLVSGVQLPPSLFDHERRVAIPLPVESGLAGRSFHTNAAGEVVWLDERRAEIVRGRLSLPYMAPETETSHAEEADWEMWAIHAAHREVAAVREGGGDDEVERLMEKLETGGRAIFAKSMVDQKEYADLLVERTQKIMAIWGGRSATGGGADQGWR